MRWQRAIVTLVGFLTLAALSGGCGDDGSSSGGSGSGSNSGSLILCSAIDGDGRADGDVLVLDTNGVLLRTVALGERPMPMATGAGRWAVYASPITSRDLWFVDTATGSVTELDAGRIRLAANPEGHRFAIAEMTPEPDGDGRVWMLDFDTGAATDLTAIIDSKQPSLVVPVAADAGEAHLLIYDASHGVWVIPTSDPAHAWDLGDRSVPGDIRDDDTQVVFRSGSDVYIGDLAGRTTHLLVSDPGTVALLQFAEGGSVLLQTGTQLLLVDQDGSQDVLWETTEESFPLSRFSMGSGGLTVVAGFDADEPTWIHVDLESRTISPLVLGDMRPLLATDDFLIMSETREVSAPLIDTLAIVDLADGGVRFVALPDDGIQPWSVISPSGDAVVLTGSSGAHHLDLATGVLTSLGPDVRAARFSPDGSHLVLDVWDGNDQGSGDIAIAPATDLGAIEHLDAGCIQPVWVPSG